MKSSQGWTKSVTKLDPGCQGGEGTLTKMSDPEKNYKGEPLTTLRQFGILGISPTRNRKAGRSKIPLPTWKAALWRWLSSGTLVSIRFVLSLPRAVYTVLRGCHRGRVQVLRAPQREDGRGRVVRGSGKLCDSNRIMAVQIGVQVGVVDGGGDGGRVEGGGTGGVALLAAPILPRPTLPTRRRARHPSNSSRALSLSSPSCDLSLSSVSLFSGT